MGTEKAVAQMKTELKKIEKTTPQVACANI